MPTWKERCLVRVKNAPAPARDSFTTFTSDRPGPVAMELNGPLDVLGDDEVPLQLGHAVMYHDLGIAAPRWASAGIGMLDQSAMRQQAYRKSCRELLAKNQLLPLNKLLPAREFPREMAAFYPQSHALTSFLVNRKDRATFLAFVGLGMRKEWDSALRRFYAIDGVQELEIALRASLSEAPAPDAKSPALPEIRVDPRWPEAPSEQIEGKIQAVDQSDPALVELSVGADAGLKKGHTLEVFRFYPIPSYLGVIRIVEVTPRNAVARHLEVGSSKRGPLIVGDQVTSRLAPAEGERRNDVVVTSARALSLPISIRPDQRNALRQVYLFVSTDRGRTWEKAGTIPPTSNAFQFNAPADGLYWFQVQVEKLDGELEPRDMRRPPALKVLIKSSNPTRP
jgi:hypothetical protein